MDLGTFRADGRALQIDTDIVLALPFQTPTILRWWTSRTRLLKSLPLRASRMVSALVRRELV